MSEKDAVNITDEEAAALGYEDDDIDLDTEEIYLPSGRRLTNEVAEELVKEVHEREERRGRGRPRLSEGQDGEAPHVRFRATQELVDDAKELAEAQHRPVSELYREALEQYVKIHKDAA